MSNFDNDLRNALAAEGEEMAYDLEKEEGLREMIARSFQGKTRWMAMLVWFESLMFTGLAVFAAIRFFQVDGLKDSIFYAALFLTLMLVIVLAKVWYWMLMNRNCVQRDIKRLELRILELSRDSEQE